MSGIICVCARPTNEGTMLVHVVDAGKRVPPLLTLQASRETVFFSSGGRPTTERRDYSRAGGSVQPPYRLVVGRLGETLKQKRLTQPPYSSLG